MEEEDDIFRKFDLAFFEDMIKPKITKILIDNGYDVSNFELSVIYEGKLTLVQILNLINGKTKSYQFAEIKEWK